MTPARITGLALLSPAGRTVEANVGAWRAGRAAGADAGLDPPLDRVPLARLPDSDELRAAEARWGDRAAALGVLAAGDALASAGLDDAWMRRDRSALVVGTSKAGVLTALTAADAVRSGDRDRAARAAANLWPWGTPGGPCAALLRRYHPGGPIHTVVAACATGLAALAQGAAVVADGRADTAVVVATDASIHPLFIGAFRTMGALARWDEVPADACRPFSADREGFVLSEGAAAIVLQAPRVCGQPGNPTAPVVTVAGAAVGSQGGHLVRPNASAAALADVIRLARARAGWADDPVALIHAHGTGTPAGDRAETAAIRRALGTAADRVVVVSTKPVTGHLLGAAGLAQAVLTVRAMQTHLIPPAVNYRRRDPACDLDYNTDGPRRTAVTRALCLANGFGGASATVALATA
ncbi:MAG: beta-ketoacyl synthase N-terminal-like domain-containing protein [Planctomycetota bacterium]